MSTQEIKVGTRLIVRSRSDAQLRTVTKVHKKYVVDNKHGEWNLPNLRRRGGSSVWDTTICDVFDPENKDHVEAMRDSRVRSLWSEIEGKVRSCNDPERLAAALEALQPPKRIE